MKYTIILVLLLMTIFSCKTKKNIAQTIPTADTFYVSHPKTGQLSMFINDRNGNPEGDWTLQYIDSHNDGEMNRISLSIKTISEVTEVSGHDGCNQYSGRLKIVNKKRIEFGPIAVTKRACFVPAKYAEAYYAGLNKVRTYHVNDRHLLFKDGNGKNVFQFIKKQQ